MTTVAGRLRARITGPTSCDVRGEITRDLRDAAEEIERLRAEIDVLRRYGNKDCTAMADAEIARHTTPFEREVLTHHFCSTASFPRQTKLYYETVDKFVAMGLLEWVAREESGSVRIRATEGARIYMVALAAVPLPVRVWKKPRLIRGAQ